MEFDMIMLLLVYNHLIWSHMQPNQHLSSGTEIKIKEV